MEQANNDDNDYEEEEVQEIDGNAAGDGMTMTRGGRGGKKPRPAPSSSVRTLRPRASCSTKRDDVTVLSRKRRQPDISRRSETGWTKNGKGANTRPPEEELHAHSEVK